ncbi:MAG: cell division protein FtsB [Gammaproteobacteria bacterium]|jgi:cell division protein FtsB|nr:cell division protein FtsB [Xanthomonadales bacterium]
MKVVNLILLFLIVIMLWMRWFGYGGSKDLQEKEYLFQQQLEKNKELKARNEQLKAEIKDLDQGMEATEERARSEMGMVKPDETFIQVIEEGSNQ